MSNIISSDVLFSNFEEETISDLIHDDAIDIDSKIIMDNIGLDKNENGLSHSYPTLILDPDVNDKISSLNNQERLKHKHTDEAIKYVTKKYKISAVDTYYKFINVFHGIVQTVDVYNNTFSATLINADNDDDILSAEFNIDDVQNLSEKELVKVGAKFVWLLGQEVKILKVGNYLKDGPQTNVSKIIFRRTKVLTPRKVQTAKENAIKWTEFFKKLSTSNPTKD